MNRDLIFRTSLAVIVALLLGIRIYYIKHMSESHNKVTANSRGRVIKFLAWTLGIVGDLTVAIYIFAPKWLDFATLPFPDGLRWTGVGLGLISIPLFLWAHHSLGKEFNYPGAIKEEQTLVITGLYQWVRHPIYTSYFIWTLAFLLISTNGLIAIIWLMLSLAIASNVGLEESALIEKFGEAYRDYMGRSGRFLPRLR